MPSVGRDPPVQSLDDDIAAVREAILKEFEVGKHVMVVSHSWSGLPVSSALVGMGKKERETNGEKGGVVKIAYIAAFVVPKGISLLDALNHEIPEWWIIKVSPGPTISRSKSSDWSVARRSQFTDQCSG